MPENAAAEGGSGLSASEAFGGAVGTGSVSASAVGGAFGGGTAADFGGGEGRGGFSSPAAQAAAASNAVSAAEAVFSNAGIQNGILGMMGLAPGMPAGSPAQSMAPSLSAPTPAQGFNPEDVFGMMAPSINPSTGGLLAGSPTSGTAPAVDNSSYAMPEIAAPNVSMPSVPAQIYAPPVSPGPPPESAFRDQSFNPEAVFGMMAPSMNPTTGGLLTGNMAMDAAPVADTAPAMQDAIASYGTGTSAMSVNPADIGGDLTGILGTPAVSTSAPVSVSPASAPAMSQSMTSRPQARPTDDRSFMGRVVDDVQMALSVNPFASREQQAQSLIDRGWNPTDVSNFMARSINTDRASRAAVENAIGARDYIPEQAAPVLPTSSAVASAPQGFFVPRRAMRGY